MHLFLKTFCFAVQQHHHHHGRHVLQVQQHAVHPHADGRDTDGGKPHRPGQARQRLLLPEDAARGHVLLALLMSPHVPDPGMATMVTSALFTSSYPLPY